MTRILVVDDEPAIRRALATNLRTRGFDVDLAESGEAALVHAADHRPDLVLLDLGLPGIDGVEVVHGLRGWTDIPIIVLSVRSDESDKVEALDAGADDFVTKPFGMNEVLARIRAALRRGSSTAAEEDPIVVAGALRIDLVDRRLRVDGLEVHLTPIEWALVEQLVRNRDRLVTQQQLLQAVWGPDHETATNYLRVHMANLRRKVEPDPTRRRHFVTEPGLGYRFRTDGD